MPISTDCSRNSAADNAFQKLRQGEIVLVQALRSDGKPYRWWRAYVESHSPEQLVTINRVGDRVEGTEPGWRYRHHTRHVYWLNRPYNLAEVYEPDGRLKQLYVHIASMPVLGDHKLQYVDHELDVIKRPRQPPRIADEDEFSAAAEKFGYTKDFQDACWRAVEEALQLVACWRPGGVPRQPRRRR